MAIHVGWNFFETEYSFGDSIESNELFVEELPHHLEIVVKKNMDCYRASIYSDNSTYKMYKFLGSSLASSHYTSLKPAKLCSLDATSIDVLAMRVDNVLFRFNGNLEYDFKKISVKEKCRFKDCFSN